MKNFPAKGIYVLVIFLSREVDIEVGKLGVKKFPKGYYTYTGSAMGKGDSSLKSRISRHLRKEKRKHWHIDYLLARQNARITAVVVTQTQKKLECNINRCLKEEEEAKIPVRGFGASDCKENCASHLIFFPDIMKDGALVNKIMQCYHHKISNEIFILRPFLTPFSTPNLCGHFDFRAIGITARRRKRGNLCGV